MNLYVRVYTRHRICNIVFLYNLLNRLFSWNFQCNPCFFPSKWWLSCFYVNLTKFKPFCKKIRQIDEILASGVAMVHLKSIAKILCKILCRILCKIRLVKFSSIWRKNSSNWRIFSPSGFAMNFRCTIATPLAKNSSISRKI